jgi:hypothetical protein
LLGFLIIIYHFGDFGLSHAFIMLLTILRFDFLVIFSA